MNATSVVRSVHDTIPPPAPIETDQPLSWMRRGGTTCEKLSLLLVRMFAVRVGRDEPQYFSLQCGTPLEPRDVVLVGKNEVTPERRAALKIASFGADLTLVHVEIFAMRIERELTGEPQYFTLQFEPLQTFQGSEMRTEPMDIELAGGEVLPERAREIAAAWTAGAKVVAFHEDVYRAETITVQMRAHEVLSEIRKDQLCVRKAPLSLPYPRDYGDFIERVRLGETGAKPADDTDLTFELP